MSKDVQLAQLRSAIDRASQLYYTPGCQSPLTDDEFESLMADLRELDPEDPRLTRVGVPYSDEDLKNKVPHRIPMGSLDNTDGGIAGFDPWYTKLVNQTTSDLSLVMSLKMDGASACVDYERGKLVRVVSRGDGRVGEDLTVNGIKWVGVPTQLPKPWTGTIRGEVMLYHEDFEAMQAAQTDDEELSNPRNVGNGIMGRNSGEDSDKLRFVAFNMVGEGNIATMTDKFKILKVLGFDVVRNWTVTGDADQIIEQVRDRFEKLEGEDRVRLPFDIDGLVVCVDDIAIQHKLTKDEKDELRPKFARAIKFATAKAATRVVGVTVTVGHTGAIVPTADLETVHVGGVNVDSALLNNWNVDSESPSAAHVKIGDVVEVERAGDVVPKITRIIQDDPDGEVIEEPPVCPACGSHTTRTNRGKEGVITFCSKPESCPAASQYRIRHYIKKTKILGVGSGLLDALTQDGLVETPVDLYKLTVESVENLQMGTNAKNKPIRVGHSRATDLIKEIDKTKTLRLDIFLGALGIDLLGQRRVKLISDEVEGLTTLDAWLDASNLEAINGDTIRESVTTGIENKRDLINELREIVTVEPLDAPPKKKNESDDTPDDSLLKGKSFCFTGTRDFQDQIEPNGGVVKSGISKKLDYLVQKDATSQSKKTEKAEGYGVKIIGIATLRAVLDGERELP